MGTSAEEDSRLQARNTPQEAKSDLQDQLRLSLYKCKEMIISANERTTVNGQMLRVQLSSRGSGRAHGGGMAWSLSF